MMTSYAPSKTSTAAAENWTEHVAPNGRKYYFNKITQKSTYEKPEELKSPQEKALQKFGWKEFSTGDGKVYYYNERSKQSSWTLPQEVKDMISNGNDRDSVCSKSVDSSFVPDFHTKEEAEAAFFAFLKEHNVTSDWTWDKAMRSLMHYPMYKSLKTSTERKEAFLRYISELKDKEEELRIAKMEENKVAFKAMLENEIKRVSFSGLNYDVIRRNFENRSEWSALDDGLRKDLVSAFLTHKRNEERAKERTKKDSISSFVKNVLETVEIAAPKEETSAGLGMNGKYVPASIRSFDWFLEEILMKNAGWDELLSQLCEQDFSQEEREVVKLEMKLEALILFENKVKQYENYVLNKKRIEKEQRFRRERKCREAFVDLLRDLRKGGRLDLNSKFKNVYPLIREQQVTKDLIAQPGSTPLDLFRDEIVRLEDEMYSDGKEVKRLMKESNVELSVDTSYDDFVKLLSQIPRFVQLRVPDDNLRAIHKILIENIQEKLKETKKKEERHKRRLYEDFKYLLKRLGVKEGSKYDDVMLQIRGRTAYEQCENDVQRREFFDKYMERLREKREDKESERPAKVRRVDNDKEEGEASTAEE